MGHDDAPKPPNPSYTTPPRLRRRILTGLSTNLNALLDAVDAFEDQGGLSSLIDGTYGHGKTRQLTGRTSDHKTLRQYYANLETPYGADRKTLKQNYRRLLRKYHPDKHSGDPQREQLATELTQELTRAYTSVIAYLDRIERR